MLFDMQTNDSQLSKATTDSFDPPREVIAYKEDLLWFIEDDNEFSKSDNLLVSGIPEIIQEIVGNKANRIKIQYSDHGYHGAIHMQLIETNPSGSTYSCRIGQKDLTGWLCPVFFWYFQVAPLNLYIRILPVE